MADIQRYRDIEVQLWLYLYSNLMHRPTSLTPSSLGLSELPPNLINCTLR